MNKKAAGFVIIGLFIGVVGCQNGRSVHLRLEGLPASLEEGAITSLAVTDHKLIIAGRGPAGGFSIGVSPWPFPALPLPADKYTLNVQTDFFPDGPSSVLSIYDRRELRVMIGYRVRENALLLGRFRLRRGEKQEQIPGERRYWTGIRLENPDGTFMAAESGGSLEIEEDGARWRMQIPGASIKESKKTGRPEDVSDEAPDFIADYILWRIK